MEGDGLQKPEQGRPTKGGKAKQARKCLALIKTSARNGGVERTMH